MDQDKEKKRQVIRNAAAELFAHKGFENTTTRDISNAAGMSKGAPYYYFESKEDLLFQILNENGSRGLKRIKEIKKSDLSLKDKLKAILEFYMEHYTVYLNEMKLFVDEQKSLSPEHREILRKKEREYERAVISILDSLKEQGQIMNFNTTVTAFAFFGMANWIYRWYNPEGQVKIPELLEIFQHIFTKGIYTDK